MDKTTNFLIFGDSYSTYEGCIPEGYATYYCKDGREDVPVTKMEKEDTWWSKLIAKTGANLLLNNSWSGSTIGYTGYNNADCSKTSSFIYRYRKLFEEGFFKNNRVDEIIVFGGTNDSWSEAPLGEMKFSSWEEKDLFFVLPAICYFAWLIKKDLPNTKVYFVVNTEIKAEIQNAIQAAAERFGAKAIVLENVDKDFRHPTKAGMTDICEEIFAAL